MPRSRHVIPLAILAVVIGGITAAVFFLIDWIPLSASEQAERVDPLMWFVVISCGVIFTIVMMFLLYSVWRFKAPEGDEEDGPPIHGNTKLEIAWTVIPTVIVLFGAGYSWVILNDIEDVAPAAERLEVNVTAQQFAWTFEYPTEGVTSHELHVPVGKQLDLQLTALDVLHSFWVPEWRIKRDLVPQGSGGDEVDDTVQVTPDVEGTYNVVCTEYCGAGHATMRALAVVESQEEFDAWIAEQDAPPAAPDAEGGGAAPE